MVIKHSVQRGIALQATPSCELATVPIDNIPDNTLIEDDSQALPSMQEIMAAINTLPNGYGKVF